VARAVWLLVSGVIGGWVTTRGPGAPAPSGSTVLASGW
jgi:hypothetical protein